MKRHDNTALATLPDTSADLPAGDAACLDAFSREQYAALLQFLRPRSRTEDDARDAAQESLARLVGHYRTQPPAEWRPMLFRIAANVANDRLRQARTSGADLHVPLEGLELAADQPSVEETADIAQQDARLREAILALPPRCRQVYLLRRVRGLTNAQVAERCGISVRMVEKHFANALAHLWRTFGLQHSETL